MDRAALLTEDFAFNLMVLKPCDLLGLSLSESFLYLFERKKRRMRGGLSISGDEEGRCGVTRTATLAEEPLILRFSGLKSRSNK